MRNFGSWLVCGAFAAIALSPAATRAEEPVTIDSSQAAAYCATQPAEHQLLCANFFAGYLTQKQSGGSTMAPAGPAANGDVFTWSTGQNGSPIATPTVPPSPTLMP